jgi:hypothetical protein
VLKRFVATASYLLHRQPIRSFLIASIVGI